ncbi:hypothetical protein [Candidatus Villigracilis saccharophilus]|uniref:hypothetical protein n=1 Tax=Candidatus Villigracilis saccharophilus TaxID=3140684 RepID=UPI003135DA11|nr:hypothetical protein [Anaerolineales bacterium]
MKTPSGRECPHFFGDYYRGRNIEECRLLKLHGQAWSSDLCKTCPVPDIARANSCQYMQLRLTVVRPITAMFQRRVQVTAFCEKSNSSVAEPQIGCKDCHSMLSTFEVIE